METIKTEEEFSYFLKSCKQEGIDIAIGTNAVAGKTLLVFKNSSPYSVIPISIGAIPSFLTRRMSVKEALRIIRKNKIDSVLRDDNSKITKYVSYKTLKTIFKHENSK